MKVYYMISAVFICRLTSMLASNGVRAFLFMEFMFCVLDLYNGVQNFETSETANTYRLPNVYPVLPIPMGHINNDTNINATKQNVGSVLRCPFIISIYCRAQRM